MFLNSMEFEGQKKRKVLLGAAGFKGVEENLGSGGEMFVPHTAQQPRCATLTSLEQFNA